MKHRAINVILLLVITLATILPALSQPQSIPSRNEYVASCFYDAVIAYNPYNPQGGKPGMGFLYPTLFIYDSANNVLLPFIAQKFEIIDKYTVRIYIRPEAKWSDGKPITAKDVYYTSWLSTQLASGPCVDCYKHIKIVSDKVFDYSTYLVDEGPKPDTPTLSLSSLLGILLAEVYPSHVLMGIYNSSGADGVKNWRNDDPAKMVVSGPYKLQSFDPYNSLVFERIDNWWGKDIFGLPKPKYFVLLGCKDNTVALGRLQNGEIDWWTGFIAGVNELFKYGIGTWSSQPPYFRAGVPIILGFNMRNPVLADPNVRKAIAYAIPYNDVIAKGYYNYSVQSTACGIVDVYKSYASYLDTNLCVKYFGNSNCRVPYDPQKAKQILLDAGYKIGSDGYFVTPDGKPIQLVASVPQGWTDWMAIIEIIANSLNKIGLKTSVVYYDAGVYFDKISKGQDIDLWMAGAEGPGPEHPLNTFRSIMVTWLASWMNYSNPQAAQLINVIPTLSDPTAIKQAYSKLEELYYKDMPAVPLFYGAIWYAYSTKYWVGWPNASNAFWGETWAGASSGLPVILALVPKGATPSVPAWAKPVSQGGLYIPLPDVQIALGKATTQQPQSQPSTQPQQPPPQNATQAPAPTTQQPTPQQPPAAQPTDYTMLIVALAVVIILVAIIALLYLKRPKKTSS
ncbi:ABC transporter substrate-binding protein [Infirmifilum uzonense]|uniref:ABC transporter substrate-binding protein n=1 Tax=Infirmifilum uzonense TaxID=1550241 RepID=UPI003C78FD95